MSEILLQADSTTLVLNGQVIEDFAEGDYIEINPVNELTSHTNSSNGGVTIIKRLDAGVTDVVVRVQKHSASDVYLNGIRNQDAPIVIEGSAQEVFIRNGTEFVEAWSLERGSMTVQPGNTKNNQDGNALQEYTIRFRNAVRTI